MTYETTWEIYVTSWKAESADEKRVLFERCLTPDCVYTDPTAQARGWNELTAYMRQLQTQVPGVHFVTEKFQSHNNRSLAHWTMRNGGGEAIGTGVSYGEYDSNGRLIRMTGFF